MGIHADDALAYIMDRGFGFGRQRHRKRPAEKQLAARRIMAHQAFDPIWQSGEMTRAEAYAWLADEMMMPREKCHMEQMSVEQCDRVIEICTRHAFKDLIK